jgi:xanthine dehydrogenase iron-sulfur cluster and FAD-binding subunit A
MEAMEVPEDYTIHMVEKVKAPLQDTLERAMAHYTLLAVQEILNRMLVEEQTQEMGLELVTMEIGAVVVA